MRSWHTISLDFWAVAVWPSTTPTLAANALTRCSGAAAALLVVRRLDSPSRARWEERRWVTGYGLPPQVRLFAISSINRNTSESEKPSSDLLMRTSHSAGKD